MLPVFFSKITETFPNCTYFKTILRLGEKIKEQFRLFLTFQGAINKENETRSKINRQWRNSTIFWPFKPFTSKNCGSLLFQHILEKNINGFKIICQSKREEKGVGGEKTTGSS